MTVNIYGNVHIYGRELELDEIEEIKETSPEPTINPTELRNTPAMNTAKKNVKKRDGACQCCGETEKQLQVHHIFPLRNYPDLATDEGNLIALCQKCHKEYETVYKDCENPSTLIKYIKDKVSGYR